MASTIRNLKTDALETAQDFNEELFEEELEDKLNAEKKAIPDAYTKLGILKANDDMLRAFKVAMDNKAFNAGNFNEYDLNEIRSCLFILYNKLAEMILEKNPKIKDKRPDDFKIMKDFKRMEAYQLNPGWNDLLRFKNFLTYHLHDLNITNLLIIPRDPFEELESGFN